MEDPTCEKAVSAGAGCHIVLPGYFTPGNMGFAELRTSRGATLYFLPWLGHTIVGSTDKKCDAKSSPAVSEDEIQYLVNEAATCLSPDIRIRRADVLSAWQVGSLPDRTSAHVYHQPFTTVDRDPRKTMGQILFLCLPPR